MPPKTLESIAVIGAGNGGHAMAADMALKGIPVRFYELPRFADNIKAAQEKGGIELTGILGEGFAKPELITTDIEKAVRGASHVFLTTQALAHEEVARMCAPLVEENQTFMMFPGSGGTLQFAKTFKDMGVTRKAYLAEAVTLPYACRMREPGWVNVHAGNREMEVVAALPAVDSEAVIESAKPAYSSFKAATHVLEVGMCNPNILVHPIGVIFNLGRIEFSGGEFWMYREGFTPSVIKLLESLATERDAILDVLGVELPPYYEYHPWWYKEGWDAFVKVSSKGPFSAQTRYISEDIPIGMMLWVSLGEKFGVDTPMSRALIHVSSVIHDTDYRVGGRTLEKLGLAGMSLDELKRYLLEG